MNGGEIAEDLQKLAGLFAQPDHDAGLGHSPRSNLLGKLQQPQSPLVARPGPDDAIETRDRLGVVVEHLRPRLDHDSNRFFIALKVGDQDLGAAAWGLAANLLDDHGKSAGPAYEVVIAIHAGNDGMLQAQCGHGLSHAARLVKVNGRGAAFGDGAESATAGAQVAQHHESRGLVAPALADVGALRALADRMQAEGPSQAFQVVVILAYGGASLEPLGFGSGSFSRWRDLDQFHHAFIVPAGESAEKCSKLAPAGAG